MAKGKDDKRKTGGRGKKKAELTARNADRHELYQAAVQSPSHEIEEVSRMFKEIRGRKALNLREDFCGTALACGAWVQSDPSRTAIGLDLDADVLAWGRRKNIEPLGVDAARVRLLQQDVISITEPKVDLVLAFNFSFCIFKQRSRLLEYFRAVRGSLVDDGVFMLDLYGGTEAIASSYETRKCKLDGKRFKYHWDQHDYNPLTNEALNHIDFSFPDGSKMKRAFSYDWRLWTPMEVRETLEEAGFRSVRIWWEEEDEDGEGTGIHRPIEKVENQAGWLCYISADR